MAAHINFTPRSEGDRDAAFIAVAATLKALFADEIKMKNERIHQLVETACDGDGQLTARATWFVQWMAGIHNVDGES